jgi:hypothetical protein
MRFEDIEEGMRLQWVCKDPWLANHHCTVAQKGSGWVVRFDDNPDKVYGYTPSDAEAFEPEEPSDPGYEPESDPLTEHPAVQKHGTGVTSDELASFTEALGSLSQSRIKGTGRAQYSLNFDDCGQKFEQMTGDELVTGFLEEAADAINYISMATIKFLAAANAAKDALDTGSGQTGLDKMREAVRRARGGDAPVQVQGWA